MNIDLLANSSFNAYQKENNQSTDRKEQFLFIKVSLGNRGSCLMVKKILVWQSGTNNVFFAQFLPFYSLINYLLIKMQTTSHNLSHIYDALRFFTLSATLTSTPTHTHTDIHRTNNLLFPQIIILVFYGWGNNPKPLLICHFP